MDEPLAVALKFGFLAVLYLFLLWVARSGLRELRRSQEATDVPDAEPKPTRGRKRDTGTPDLRDAVEPRLEVVAAMGHDPGASWSIREGATLGRSDSADIRVDDLPVTAVGLAQLGVPPRDIRVAEHAVGVL